MYRLNGLIQSLTAIALVISIPAYSVNEELYQMRPRTPLRIQKLMPDDLAIDLPIDPAIPDDFVAMGPSGILTSAEAFFWGPRTVLEDYFKNPNSLKQAILRVKLGTALQSELGENADEGFAKELSNIGLTGFKSRRYQWDDLPVYSIRAATPEKKLHLCWIGINHPNQFTFNFELVFPQCQKDPSQKDMQLWDTFLSQTKALRGIELMQSAGLYLFPGYTVYDKTDAKVKPLIAT